MDDISYGRRRRTSYITVALFALVAGMLGERAWYSSRGNREAPTDTVRTEVIDTIPYYEPVARDSVVVRYVTKVLKVAEPAADAAGTVALKVGRADAVALKVGRADAVALKVGVADAVGTDGTLVATKSQQTGRTDSVAVEIPITQKEYIADEYRAYVSGYMPNLDSIFVHEKTVSEKVVVAQQQTQRSRQPRFGVGVITGVGYGVINKKPDVYVGVGAYLRLW